MLLHGARMGLHGLHGPMKQGVGGWVVVGRRCQGSWSEKSGIASQKKVFLPSRGVRSFLSTFFPEALFALGSTCMDSAD